jgi:hypothetical protein
LMSIAGSNSRINVWSAVAFAVFKTCRVTCVSVVAVVHMQGKRHFWKWRVTNNEHCCSQHVCFGCRVACKDSDR